VEHYIYICDDFIRLNLTACKDCISAWYLLYTRYLLYSDYDDHVI